MGQAAIPAGNLQDGSGDLAGAASEEVFAANISRQYLLIQNQGSADMHVNFGTAAVADQPSILIAAGAALEFSAGGTGVVPTGTVNIIGTTGEAFTAKQA